MHEALAMSSRCDQEMCGKPASSTLAGITLWGLEHQVPGYLLMTAQ